MKISKQRIIKSFSKSARHYDGAADVQKYVADILLEKLKEDSIYPKRTLDIGTGTGYLCKVLRNCFTGSQVFGCDASFEMVRQAPHPIYPSPLPSPQRGEGGYKGERGLAFQVADAENLPYKNAYFDLITSNASYQWSRDLTRSFHQAHRILQPGGFFCFSIFGKNTFLELKSSIEKANIGQASIELASESFVDPESLKSHLIKAGFHNIDVSSQRIIRQYSGLMNLLHRLKRMGANLASTSGIKGLQWRQILRTIETIYKDEYGRGGHIPATYEVFFAKAEK